MMQLLEAFIGQGWQVMFASPAKVGDNKADLAAMGIDECAIELNSASFDAFVAHLQPDIVLFDRFMMEEQFAWRVEKHCPNALRVIETVDIQSLRDARQIRLKEHLRSDQADDAPGPLFDATLDDLFDQMSEADITQRELAAIYRSDVSLVISTFEMDLLIQRFGVPPALLHWCPLMLDDTRPQAPDFAERRHFLSIGNFRHAPNWDAVLWMKNHLWPQIRRRLPQAQLHIYGAYMPPKASALHNPAQGFLMRGWASDALEVMGQSRVALAPLRFGAGIKGKLVDAMLCGTPSVTTPIGAEGMHGDNSWPGAISHTVEELVTSAVDLYSNETSWQAAHTKAANLLEQHYSFDVHAKSLIDCLQRLMQTRARHRKDNFIGAMLRHHQHKSTQYFSQWIETKNRLSIEVDGAKNS